MADQVVQNNVPQTENASGQSAAVLKEILPGTQPLNVNVGKSDMHNGDACGDVSPVPYVEEPDVPNPDIAGTSITEEDIYWVMREAEVGRDRAIATLRKTNCDVVNAILVIFTEDGVGAGTGRTPPATVTGN